MPAGDATAGATSDDAVAGADSAPCAVVLGEAEALGAALVALVSSGGSQATASERSTITFLIAAW